MDPLVIKEVYDAVKALQKINDVSSKIRSVCESEGKNKVVATKDVAASAAKIMKPGMTEKSDVSGKNLNAEAGNMQPGENKGSGASKEVKNEGNKGNLDVKNSGPEKQHCINERYAGMKHPETGVPYVEKVVKTGEGKEVVGVFPQFESKFDAQLPKDLLQESDSKQFAESNSQLKKKFDSDADFSSQFNERQQDDIKNNRTPYGFVWHHNEEAGKMQLVDYDTHEGTKHTGGKSVWGGGRSNR